MIKHIDNPLRLARIKSNLSPEEAARALGITKGYLLKLEAGRATPSFTVALKMRGVYKTTLDELFRGLYE
jgi:transcriptional regulator with XRE-family HTH domain